jgi:hypothetical protein
MRAMAGAQETWISSANRSNVGCTNAAIASSFPTINPATTIKTTSKVFVMVPGLFSIVARTMTKRKDLVNDDYRSER